MKKGTALLMGLVWLAFLAAMSHTEMVVIDMHYITKDGVGKKIGTVTAKETPYGTLFTPKLSGLSPGLHGFHVHENPSCEAGEKNGKTVPGLAAGGHYDPGKSGVHKGPYAEGHLGDLPPLNVDSGGKSVHPVLAPRIKVSDLKGRALMVHAHGDNYSDRPKRLGGGGGRVACGVIKP